MVGYVTLGTNNFEGACTFYNALFEVIGVKLLWQTDSIAAWGASRQDTALCVAKPFNSEEASVGNGVMVALKMDSRLQVDLMHEKALELGAINEGNTGTRGENGFYGGYFRDLDGNKLNIYIPAKSK